MTITINGVEYAFEINGTVGIVYMAQRILGDEEFDPKNQYHNIVLYYAAFHASNKDKKNIPDLQTFLSNLTTKMLTDITTYFWQRWNELEGVSSLPDEKKEDDKPGED